MAVNLRWAPVLGRARELVDEFTERQGVPPTLRQVHYRLLGMSVNGVAYEERHYGTLSEKSAELRRLRTFPRLADNTRGIVEHRTWADADAHLDWAARVHRRDRSAEQKLAIYLGVEKRGMAAQLDAWFGDRGLPILPLGGTHSEAFEHDVLDHIEADGRPALLIYGGDWDASGELILKNFCKWVPFAKVVHVALTVDQIFRHRLPLVESRPDPEAKNTHWPKFRDRHRETLVALGWDGNDRQPVQVELDALPAEVLRQSYAEAIDEVWDEDAYQAVLRDEEDDRAQLRVLAKRRRRRP